MRIFCRAMGFPIRCVKRRSKVRPDFRGPDRRWEHAVSQVLGVARSVGDSSGIFSSTSGSRSWRWTWLGLLRRPAGLPLRLLQLLSLRMRALWLLRAKLVRRWGLHRRRSLVSRIRLGTRLGLGATRVG